jgi:hypothetical protein
VEPNVDGRDSKRCSRPRQQNKLADAERRRDTRDGDDETRDDDDETRDARLAQ